MAIIQSKGILEVTSKPTYTPEPDQASLARLQNSLTLFYHVNEGNWATINLEKPEVFNGEVIGDNVSLGTALQQLSDAIEAIALDGNHTPIVRASTTENVEPSQVEVPDPINGDTADVNLSSGRVEKWVFTSNSWSKSFTIDYNDVTNLAWVAGTSGAVIESSTGNNAIVPAVNSSKAGLMLPAHKGKLDFISVTQDVDLDQIESYANTAVQSFSTSSSIFASKVGTAIAAELRLSATQGTDMSVTIQSDGLRVVYNESKPTAYGSRSSAQTALGANRKFIYTKANLDGAVEGSEAWT